MGKPSSCHDNLLMEDLRGSLNQFEKYSFCYFFLKKTHFCSNVTLVELADVMKKGKILQECTGKLWRMPSKTCEVLRSAPLQTAWVYKSVTVLLQEQQKSLGRGVALSAHRIFFPFGCMSTFLNFVLT